MREKNLGRTRSLAIAATVVMVLSLGLPVIAGAFSHAGASVSAAPAATAAVVPSSPKPATQNNVPGTLEIYTIAPGGATSEDPAVAYDTVSYEPMLNTFETLVDYNGSKSDGSGTGYYGIGGAFVPALSTCVPGTHQCVKDYSDGNLIANGTQKAEYWTFPIDPAARFYDPGTGKSWPVYPTDVMFSMAREMAYSEAIGVGNTPGWLIAQALLPNGSATWDGGVHGTYNTTPADIYGSMLINSSTYCPATAISHGNGCITFNVDGQGGSWPFFLQLIGDGFMGTLPCGWYTMEGAGVPGWNGTGAAHGDGSCTLPGDKGGANPSTSGNAAWTKYLTYLAGTSGAHPASESWDSFELHLATSYPAPAPNVQWSMVGSGPYYSVVTPHTSPPGYSLFQNPAYVQPTGCSGAGGFGTYGGYCWPAADPPNAGGPGNYVNTDPYIPNVFVYYEPSDVAGINAYKGGTADLAGIFTTDTGELLTLDSEGLVNYYSSPSLSTFFLPFNMNWSSSAFKTASLPGSPNIPSDFFAGEAARALLTHTFPYGTAEATANVVDNVQYGYMAGGPVAEGMVNYPSNVSYPYLTGNPDTNPADVGGAAWWWAQGTNPTSTYYDPELAACLKKTCVFPIIGENGAPNLDIMIGEFITEIESITSNHIQPYTFDLNFGGPGSLLAFQLGGEGPGAAPLPFWNLGWAADNFDPQDYLIPMAFPDSTYTYGDAVYEQFNLPRFDNPTACGHAPTFSHGQWTATLQDLVYWGKQAQLADDCQGVAYDVADAYFYASTHTGGVLDTTYYWAIQAILNALGLYVFYDQTNQVTSAAPWILGSSINTNPTAGGGGDQFYFQLKYAPTEYAQTFSQTGLTHKSWSIVTSTPNLGTKTNLTGGDNVLGAPAGKLYFNISSTAGTVTSVTGATAVGTGWMTTVTGPASISVVFKAKVAHGTSVVTFAETGLPAGDAWTVAITPKGGTTVSNGTTAPGNVTFTVPNGTKLKYVISAAGGYKGKTTGSLTVKAAVTVTTALTQEFVKVTFKEKGLKHTTWWVTIPGIPGVNNTSGTGSSLSLMVPFGTWEWTVATVPGYTNSPGSGLLTIGTTKPVKVDVYYGSDKVTFKEKNLPKGTTWYVNITNVTNAPVISLSGTGSSLSTTLPWAFYNYTVQAAGYTGATGNFTLSTFKALTVTVSFVKLVPLAMPFDLAAALPGRATG